MAALSRGLVSPRFASALLGNTTSPASLRSRGKCATSNGLASKCHGMVDSFGSVASGGLHSREAMLGGHTKLRTLAMVPHAQLQTEAPAPSDTLHSASPSSAAAMDWDDLGFGLRETDFMYARKCELGQPWLPGELLPYGNLHLSPSAGVLNYGQGVFEGLKAYNTEDGRILLFRPMENALRMVRSAERMSMPAPPPDEFVAAVHETVLANKRWIPPPGKGSLYIRPLLIGSGPILGLGPSPEYTFLIYVSPVGNYFKGLTLTPIALKVEENFHRAAPGGSGEAKAIGNYSQVLKVQLLEKANGFSDVLFLDSVENKYVEEVSSCNIFIVKDGKVFTPELRGTILPGITRKSIIELARSHGYEVEERPVEVVELLEADEVFCTGTAVVVSPVGSATFRGKKVVFSGGEAGVVAKELYEQLTGVQMGGLADSFGWTYIVS